MTIDAPPVGRTGGADYGDDAFGPDVAIQSAADKFAAIYQQKLGVQLRLTIVAGKTLTDVAGADGGAPPIDEQGRYTQKPTICRIRITPSGQLVPPEPLCHGPLAGKTCSYRRRAPRTAAT